MTTTATTAELPTAPHAATTDAVGLILDVRPELGLSHQQSMERLAKWGPNALPVAPPRSPWRVLLAQFKGVMTVILLGAAVLAASVGSIKDASVILAVVIINALVGFAQEYRAEPSLDALKSMLPVNATVRRDGSSEKIRAETVVPGDILLLEAGDSVAADGRLIVAAGLEIDESTLTGESRPAAKQCAQPVAAGAPLGDRNNMAYMNTLLTHGRAELLVTATGSDTETGRLSRELAAIVESPTPLQAQLDQLAKRLGVIALTLVALCVAAHDEWLGTLHRYVVLTAVASIPPRAASFLDRETVKAYYLDEAEKVFKPVRAFFKQRGIEAEFVSKVGPAADVIAKYASSGSFDLLMMGSHGHGSVVNVVMGSVATKVLAGCKVPVLLVR